MKSLFSKFILLIFVALLSANPAPAHAGPYTGAGPGEGMFDCLGDLDWGCKIIGFLFETTDHGNDNSVTYVKDGRTVRENPTTMMAALREMMRFFSHALLIFASIKLLYELIQMTAESAQTGQVGGKDANKLWAPIRLVIAIGLLVPLESGLNSGQFIVLQIAKWGSGMASQAWKVFVVKLSDTESLTKATPPRIRNLAVSTFKSYACQQFVNYYAEETKLPAAMVNTVQQTDDTSRIVFQNKFDNNVCGVISYNVPTTNPGNSTADSNLSFELTKKNYEDFLEATPKLRLQAITWAKRFLPEGRNYPRPTTEDIDNVIKTYQKKVEDRLTQQNAYTKTAMDAITQQIQLAANSQGWTSAGSWFLAITRSQGQIINGASNIPDATGPNLDVLANYPAAYRDYLEFQKHLADSSRPQDNTTTPATSSSGPSVGSEAIDERSWWDAPAEVLFKVLDRLAIAVGLWSSDPKKAFGDLGSSTNPFGEIAALGHRKIQLALRYVGLAAGSSVLGFGTNAASRMIGLKGNSDKAPIARQALGLVSGAAAGITALLMMIATLFFLAGVLLAYIVPLLPFTRFFFSILTWLGSLIEAMILVPMMALAFLTPKGEGFAGPNTRNAFFLIFQLFLRPILCIFGLMCAMILFYVAAKFLNASFYEATSGVGNYQGHAMRFIQKLVYSVMYVGLIYSAANISFKMIEHMPKHALKWMGGSASEESYDDHNNFMGIATAVGGQQLLGQFQSLPEKLMAPLTQGYEGRKSHNDAALAKYRHEQELGAMSGRNGSTDSQMPRLGGSGTSGGGGPTPTGGGSPSGGGGSGGSGGGAAASPGHDSNHPSLLPTSNNASDTVGDGSAEQQTNQAQIDGHQAQIDNEAQQLANIHSTAEGMTEAQQIRYAQLTTSIQYRASQIRSLGGTANMPNNIRFMAPAQSSARARPPAEEPAQIATPTSRTTTGGDGSGGST